ncbi:double-stranded RNA-specific editase B2 isoform X1 [Lates japonicus]|uniref:Double-stranded RNA-specific editase B2 isoform X1 n=1 Tax=Lates japonicus TaxID=270547 RepID=A0AAD3MK52_LATJO|nr:double-stranded RNA-specific editase B2 isoform X1 [Lates japonicus]
MPKFLQRRGKLSERSGGDGAPVSVLLRAATLRCEQSLRELQASWSFRGDTGTARRAPPLVWRDKKGGRAENIVRVYVKPEDAALSESSGG